MISGVISSIKSDSIFLPAIFLPISVSEKTVSFFSLTSMIFFLDFRLSNARRSRSDKADSSIGSFSSKVSSGNFFDISSFEAIIFTFPFSKFISALFFKTQRADLNSLSDSFTESLISCNGLLLWFSIAITRMRSGS